MQGILVAVRKHGLSPNELKGLRSLEGRVYEHVEQFYADIDDVVRAPSANVKIIFGNVKAWAEYLGNEPFNNSAYIYITIKIEENRK